MTRILVHPCKSIYLESFYSNIEPPNRHNEEGHHPAEIACFADSFSALEEQNFVTFSCSCGESRFDPRKVRPNSFIYLVTVHQNTMEREFCGTSCAWFGRSVLRIRQFCLLTLPVSENLHSSEKTIRLRKLRLVDN